MRTISEQKMNQIEQKMNQMEEQIRRLKIENNFLDGFYKAFNALEKSDSEDNLLLIFFK